MQTLDLVFRRSGGGQIKFEDRVKAYFVGFERVNKMSDSKQTELV